MNNLDPLLSAQQLADYLQVPIATIYAWRHRHQGPPGFRVGKHLRFRWADVQDWIGANSTGSSHQW
jgi:excisionase family DNA binding protein